MKETTQVNAIRKLETKYVLFSFVEQMISKTTSPNKFWVTNQTLPKRNICKPKFCNKMFQRSYELMLLGSHLSQFCLQVWKRKKTQTNTHRASYTSYTTHIQENTFLPGRASEMHIISTYNHNSWTSITENEWINIKTASGPHRLSPVMVVVQLCMTHTDAWEGGQGSLIAQSSVNNM